MNTTRDILPVWAWATIVIITALLLATITDVLARLWYARRHPAPAPPYDWRDDDRLLDEWARDEEGELLTVIPTSWLYR